jgi:SAM-dependent methyltransferase
MREAGVPTSGVDIDDGMVKLASDNGHDVALNDAISHLETLPDSSLAGVFCAHFLEHLVADDVQRVYHQAARVLRPDGRFVAAVPNAACLSILSYDFWRDPTHVRFYDPVALAFFARQAGLEVVETGGNPRNHPGPPPNLPIGAFEPQHSMHQATTHLIQHAQTLLGERSAGQEQTCEPGPSGFTEETLWSELGHILSTLDRSVQQLQHELAVGRTAYAMLLRQLYPPNEVYIVTRRPESDA